MQRVRDRLVDLRMFLAALPVSFRVRRALRSHRDMTVLLAAVDAMAAGRRPRRWWGATARVPTVAGWCFRFTDRSCVGRSLTAFALLRRQGESPSFLSGVVALDRGDPETVLDGHAWLELGASPIGDADRDSAERYRELFRYPPLVR